ncbi:LptA/OstA family protein [Leptospira interrogans]
MAIASDTRGRQLPAGPAPAATGSESDREVAFAKARRHSFMVRWLKRLLPAAAIATLASYGLFMQHSIKIGEGTLTVGPVVLSTDVLTMHNPRYEGFNEDGGRFQVSAKTAEQAPVENAPIKLNGIDGSIVQANKTTTRLVSPRGLFNNKANELELFESIEITSSDGMTARLKSAKAFMKEGKILSTEPVTVDMPTGSLKGNSLLILQKSREMIFGDGVTASFKPPERKPADPGEAKRTTTESFMGNSNAPVNVQAPTLRVDDANKKAIFTENVRAEQDGSTLTTRELEIFYDGANLGAGAPAGQAAASGRLKKLIARDDVVLIRGNDRVTTHLAEFDPINESSVLTGAVIFTSGVDRQAVGDNATLDFKSDTALLTGAAVSVTQGKNSLRGRRLFVDRKNGTMQLASPAEMGLPQGRIAARFHQPETRTKKAAPEPRNEESVGLRFQTDPNAPIDIEADILDVNDNARTATFHGDVQAVQGEFTIRTVELVATYSGQAGVNLMQQPDQPGAQKASAQLQRVQAHKKVVVTSKSDQSATGDWADFDVKSNTVTLGGDVVLNQGRNVVRGPRLVIDMVTGVSRMETDKPAAGAATTSSAPAAPGPREANGPQACGGRMCAVFYPKDAKAALKRGVDKALPKGAKEGSESSTGASSWNSTTTSKGTTQ